MKLDEVLRTAWQEDRSEVRLIKDRIQSTCSYLIGGSFAVTAFLLGHDLSRNAELVLWVHFLVDPTFIVLLWALFTALYSDLKSAHQCKEEREDLIRELLKNPQIQVDPFPNASNRTPRITEGRLYLLPVLGTIAMLIKFALISWGLE
jgi:hypothetical protein